MRENFREVVKNHCHITGKCQGAAHSFQCFVFYNSKSYDTHLIFQEPAKFDGDITCIENNVEKYIGFTLNGFAFLDSHQLLRCQERNARSYFSGKYRE